MDYKEEVKLPMARIQASFHGESWYKCPHCGTTFEYYDTVYERLGIKRLDSYVFSCGKCGKVFRMSR